MHSHAVRSNHLFEDLDLNVSDVKVETPEGFGYTYNLICNGPTSRRACSETSPKYCC